MTMESSAAGNFGKTSQALADKASDKIQAGIRSAQQSAKDAGDSLASKVSEVHDKAVPVIRNAGSRAQSTLQQGFDTVSDIAGQARDVAATRSVTRCRRWR
jgi:type IV secretory pathway TrbL component